MRKQVSIQFPGLKVMKERYPAEPPFLSKAEARSAVANMLQDAATFRFAIKENLSEIYYKIERAPAYAVRFYYNRARYMLFLECADKQLPPQFFYTLDGGGYQRFSSEELPELPEALTDFTPDPVAWHTFLDTLRYRPMDGGAMAEALKPLADAMRRLGVGPTGIAAWLTAQGLEGFTASEVQSLEKILINRAAAEADRLEAEAASETLEAATEGLEAAQAV